MTDQKACLDKCFLNFLNAVILKLIRTVRHTSAPVYLTTQAPLSLTFMSPYKVLCKRMTRYWELFNHLWKEMRVSFSLKLTALAVLFLLNMCLIWVKRYYPKKKSKFLEKGLGFSPTPSFTNEEDLQRDLNTLAKKLRWKWYCRNENQDILSEVSSFKSKTTWNPPKGSPALELFLRKIK